MPPGNYDGQEARQRIPLAHRIAALQVRMPKKAQDLAVPLKQGLNHRFTSHHIPLVFRRRNGVEAFVRKRVVTQFHADF